MRMHEETGELQLLIKWKGFTDEENSWKPATSINADAPALTKLFYSRNKSHQYANELANIVSRKRK